MRRAIKWVEDVRKRMQDEILFPCDIWGGSQILVPTVPEKDKNNGIYTRKDPSTWTYYNEFIKNFEDPKY
jgi:hypothetical protein